MSDTWIIQRPIAHRGLWNDEMPENSIGAVECAIAVNFPIEIDVQMLADGEMIVFHDRAVMRMTGHAGILSRMTIDAVKNMRLMTTHYTIPSLQAVLDRVNGRVPILIEMKCRGCSRKKYLQHLKQILMRYDGVYALSSFDPILIKVAKEHFPHILCGQNFSDHRVHGVISGWFRKIGACLMWISTCNMPDFFVCHASLLPRCWVARIAKKNNRPLLTWGIVDDEMYTRIAHMIDNEIFDHRPYHGGQKM